MDYMYETKGAQRVAINQLGPATVRPSPNASAPRRSAFDLSHRRRRPRRPLTRSRGATCIARTCSSSRRLASSFTDKGISQYERDAYDFKIASAEPPSAEQLAFSKEKEAPGDALVGKSILYNWPVVGWCVGQVVERIAHNGWALVQDD